MVKIDFIDVPIEDMLHKIASGEKIHRINMDNLVVADLGDKSVNVIIRDEQKYPDKYAYFVVRKEEEICIEGEVKYVYKCSTTGLECCGCKPGPCGNRYLIKEL